MVYIRLSPRPDAYAEKAYTLEVSDGNKNILYHGKTDSLYLSGLFFGLFCSIPYLFIGGWSMAVTWWVAGIPYDIIHCVSNFALCLLLFKPLCAIMRRVTSEWQ